MSKDVTVLQKAKRVNKRVEIALVLTEIKKKKSKAGEII